jgi:hypothetical protein
MEDIPKGEDMPAPTSSQEITPQPQEVAKPGAAGSGTEIDNALEQLESSSKKFTEEFSALCDEFKVKNKNFLNDIDLFRENLEKKYGQENPNEKVTLKNKALDSDSRFRTMTEKPIQLVNKMTVLYTSLFEMVKSNMNILSHFLNTAKDLDKRKDLKDFFSEEFKNIVDSWLVMKLDFDNLNINEALNNANVDDNFRNFIVKVYKKKSLKIYVHHMKGEIENEESKKKFKEEKKSLNENAPNLTKLTWKNAGDLNKVIDKTMKYPKLKNFSFENGKINDEDFTFVQQMPNLEKLSIKYVPNFQVEILIQNLPLKLKMLYLEKLNFVNDDFKIILKKFNYNKDILANLEVFSLAGNNITKADFTILSSKIVYQSLVEINLKKNKLYKFLYNPENFPKLKFINCCKNNFNKSYFKDAGKIMSLESGNGFLFEPDLCRSYYDSLKKKICTSDDLPYLFDYLNISFMPKFLSKDYFRDFGLNEQLMNKLKKLDLSYNGINCTEFFAIIEKNNNFSHLHSLNLNGNNIDDTFFEKLMKNNAFPKLEHLYLNSNRIGDTNVKVQYRDDIPIDKEHQQEKEKNLVFKLRLLYKFIEQTPHLNKLTITKNPISEFYSVVKGENADKSDKFIKRDNSGKIAINCLFSMLIKIRDELLTSDFDKEKRKGFNLKFDCRSNVNKNSENYPYNDKPFIKKM